MEKVQYIVIHYTGSHPARGVWIEMTRPELKCRNLTRLAPHGASGLKLEYCHQQQWLYSGLASMRGKWIEIRRPLLPASSRFILPRTG